MISTLASRSFASWLEKIRRDSGYKFRLVFVCLSCVELNLERVNARVALGGHDVPADTVRRRFYRSIRNLFDLYLPLADEWEIFDNTDQNQLRLIAEGRLDNPSNIADAELWKNLRSHLE